MAYFYFDRMLTSVCRSHVETTERVWISWIRIPASARQVSLGPSAPMTSTNASRGRARTTSAALTRTGVTSALAYQVQRWKKKFLQHTLDCFSAIFQINPAETFYFSLSWTRAPLRSSLILHMSPPATAHKYFSHLSPFLSSFHPVIPRLCRKKGVNSLLS